MKTNIRNFAILPLLGAALAFGSCTKDAADAATPDTELQQPPVTETYAHEVLVKFEPYVAEIIEGLAKTRSGAVTRSGILSVDEVLDLIEGCEIERIFPVDAANEARTRESGMHLWYVVRFEGNQSAEEAASRLSKLGEVQKATPNRSIKRAYNADKKAIPLSNEALARLTASNTRADAGYRYNDPLLPRQWHIINRGDMFTEGVGGVKSIAGADVQCENAWNMTTGDPSIVVAVVDEGICLEHPDLKYNLWNNEGEIYGSLEDNDGNGYAGDYYGYDFFNGRGLITWDGAGDSGHATHVAGVIAAQNNNGIGIGSIAGGTPDKPGVRIMTCQIFANGYASSSTVMMARAIKYAADNGAVILQCSFGYTSGSANGFEWGYDGFTSQEEWEYYCPLEKEAFEYFTHNAGSPNGPIDGGVAIFAAGNEGAPAAGFPGAADYHVSVVATAADYTPAVYSNYGTGSTISAPGGDQNYYWDYGGPEDPEGLAYGELGCVLSTLPYNISESGYGYMEGTSMACPHVSGVVALGLSYAMQLKKHFTADEFKAMLYETVTPITDQYLTGTKIYYRYVADVGLNQKMQMQLNSYRGKMGAGQVNAEKLLKAIEGGGRQIEFPNLYVALDGSVTVIPGNYFLNGESQTYTLKIDDESVASGSISGNKMTVKGLKAGTTKASVTSSGGTTQSFVITVRKGANDKGWL